MADRFDPKRAEPCQEQHTGSAIPAVRARFDVWRQALAFVSDAVFIHQPGGPFLEVNEAACRVLGYTLDELRRMRPQDIDAPDFAALVPGRMAELELRGQTRFESVHIAKNGVRIPVEIHARRIELEGVPHLITVARDITSHKKLLEQLRQANEGLEQRVTELEVRLAFQDDMLASLSAELATQQRIIERLQQQVVQLARRQEDMQVHVGEPIIDVPPPHY